MEELKLSSTFFFMKFIYVFRFIFGDNNKNMCLLRLASIEESLNAMAYLHDSDISGR